MKKSIKNVKRYVVLSVLVICAVAVRAQFDPQMGQYMYMQSAYNPAAAGEGDLMKVAGLHRMQWIGITNAPMTTFFSFTSPFVIGKTKHGAGVRFMNDRFGLFSNQSLHFQYAYRHKIGKGYLSAGVELGFVNVGFKGDSVNLKDIESQFNAGSGGDGYVVSSSDQAIPSGSKSGMSFDMSVGIEYVAPTWWVSASYSHLTMPKIDWDDYSELKLVGTMYVAGGYNWRIKNHKDWQLKPSAMVMSDFRSWDVNVTLMCEFKDRYRWGLGYRIAGSVNILLGIDIISGLQLGYTFEIPHNKLMLESAGTHEIYLAYGFNILKPKRTNRYKSVRYL